MSYRRSMLLVLSLALTAGGANAGAAPAIGESVVYAFHGSDGAYPYAGLIADKTGALYGTTTAGGTCSGCGTVFKLAPTKTGYTQTVIHSFDGLHGSVPTAGVVADAAGALYGTASAGGTYGLGTVFKLTPSGAGYKARVLHIFRGSPDGSQPYASLHISKTGVLYGTTLLGGSTNAGVVFELAPSGSGYKERILYSFQHGSDGAFPYAGLIGDSAGALFGTTSAGGSTDVGTVFKLTPSGTGYAESVLYSFRVPPDGAVPYAALIADESGALYSTTFGGGTANQGVVFELQRSKSGYQESVLYSFQGGVDGGVPVAGLLEGKEGMFYGTTTQGGTGSGCQVSSNGCGTVYSVTSKGVENVLYGFRGGTDGVAPYGTLIADRGALLGTAQYGGGADDKGVVFKVVP